MLADRRQSRGLAIKDKATRACLAFLLRVSERERARDASLPPPLPLKEEFSLYQKLITGRKSLRGTQSYFLTNINLKKIVEKVESS